MQPSIKHWIDHGFLGRIGEIDNNTFNFIVFMLIKWTWPARFTASLMEKSRQKGVDVA